MKNPNFDNTTPNQNPLALKEVHYYISNDKTHDTLFVDQYVLTLHLEYLKGKGCYLKEHIVWNNGCSTQFKSAWTWYYVARYPRLMVCEQRFKGLEMC
jgi:hypothetical protein